MNFPVFDLHCDTAYVLLGDDFKQHRSLWKNNGHIDLDRASKFPGYVQCFACFTSPADADAAKYLSPQALFQLEYSEICKQVLDNSDTICMVQNVSDIQKNLASGRMSAILTIEGPAGFNYDVEMLPDLYKMGFRITTLSWNERNCLTGSHCTGGGLTKQGRDYVKMAQQLGMLVDVSHISDEAFWDIMNVTQKPVIASHSNSRAVWPVSRNVTDDMFLAICRTGGVVGINQYAEFLGEQPDLDTVCDHIFHFLELDPECKHIALGGDLDGCDCLSDGFNGVESYPKLANRLITRGLSDKLIENIFWNNALGVIEGCCT